VGFILLLLYNLGFNKASMYGKEKERKAVDFLSKRKLFISIAGLVIATGIAVTVVNGVRGKGAFNFDLEFSGGTTTTVAFNEEYTLEEAEDKITYWIDDCLYQVQRIPGTREYQIVKLN
jgi:SecD/SecF fusion protein